MNKQNFRMSLYRSYKWLALDTGFFFAMIYVIVFIRKYPSQSTIFYLALFFVMSLLILGLSRTLDYFAVEEGYLVIYKFFWKTKIAIKDLQVIGYRSNALGGFGLTFRYSNNGRQVDRVYDIRSYDVSTLNDLNKLLKSINTNIQIDVDERVEKYMKKEQSLQGKAPLNKVGWLVFIVKWFLFSFIITYVFLYFAIKNLN